jgi:hypothetical protein
MIRKSSDFLSQGTLLFVYANMAHILLHAALL